MPTLPGDANLAGRVDINDLTIVLTNFGQTGLTWSQGDFTYDGRVNINDLTAVLSHFGQTLGASQTVDCSAAVPEPSSLVLLGTVLALLLYFCRRRAVAPVGPACRAGLRKDER